jgi:hypothetical protein
MSPKLSLKTRTYLKLKTQARIKLKIILERGSLKYLYLVKTTKRQSETKYTVI